MPNKLFQTIAVVSIVSLALFAGVLFCAVIAISPSLALLDATQFTIVKQAQIKVLQVSMTAISTIYIFVAIYLLYYAKKKGLSTLFKMTLMAVVLVIITLGYSAFTDIPINVQILGWLPSNPPANWAELRDAWDSANNIRTVPTVLAMVFQSIALLFSNQK